jgi:hypothetical protein
MVIVKSGSKANDFQYLFQHRFYEYKNVGWRSTWRAADRDAAGEIILDSKSVPLAASLEDAFSWVCQLTFT